MKQSRAHGTAAAQLTSELRHQLKNRLAAISNAAFYIQRQAESHGWTQTDARLDKFFALIRKEVKECEEVLTSRLTVAHLMVPEDSEAGKQQ